MRNRAFFFLVAVHEAVLAGCWQGLHGNASEGGFEFFPFCEGTFFPRKEQEDMKSNTIPVSERYMLTVTEAARYYSIGVKRMRMIAEEHLGEFAVINGNKYLIIREKFEAFLAQTSAI